MTSVLGVRKEDWGGTWSLMMVTRDGVAKKVDAASFKDVRRSGLIAMTLHDDDALISARFVGKGDDISLVTAKGQSIRFKESDIRQMGRTAAGVRGMKANPGYVAAKAGVVGLTKALAIDHGPDGVRVNCVAPAVIETPLLDQLRPEAIEYMTTKIPMGRMGRAEEVEKMYTELSESIKFSRSRM